MMQSQSPVAARTLAVPGSGEPGRPGHDPLELPGTPWSVRTAGTPGARPSLEVYAHGILLDVVVATPLATAVLCGACRASAAGAAVSLAWGRLPAGGAPVAVEFSTRGLRARTQRAGPAELGWWFWIAPADGEFTTVTVTHPGGRERCRVRRP
jgi:hypothetical protein